MWKTITNYPDYEVSSNGSIRFKEPRPKKLGPSTHNHNGMVRVTLKNKSGYRKFYLAKLLAELFLPKPKDLNRPVIGYRDDDKSNLSIDNLYWKEHPKSSQRGHPWAYTFNRKNSALRKL